MGGKTQDGILIFFLNISCFASLSHSSFSNYCKFVWIWFIIHIPLVFQSIAIFIHFQAISNFHTERSRVILLVRSANRSQNSYNFAEFRVTFQL